MAKKTEPAPTTPDPIEIAMEAEASGAAPLGVAHEVLRKQSVLIGWQIAGERAGFALKVLTAMAGLVAAWMFGAMVWDAAHDRSIVVVAFSAPPAYAEQGLTGEVLAGRFMDRLRYVQRTTARGSIIAARDLREDADAISIEIPQTGLSIDELRRWLTDWLGRRTTIHGALSTAGDGTIILEIQVGAEPAVRVSGPAAQLDDLMQGVAEQAFSRTAPNQLSIYLRRVGRADEGLAAARAHALSLPAGAASIGQAYSLWGLSDGDLPRAAGLMRKAIELNPKLMAARRNLASTYLELGREQQAHDTAATALTLKARDQPADIRRDAIVDIQNDLRRVVTIREGDFLSARAAVRTPRGIGEVLALMHDGAQARAVVLAGEGEEALDARDAAYVRVKIAESAHDWPAMADAAAALATARGAWLAAPAYPGGPSRQASVVNRDRDSYARQRTDIPLQALALARTGRVAEARALIGEPPADCAPCLRARAVVEAEAGDWAAAEAWFARAAAAAPRLPQADLAWGEALLARGDPARAIPKLSAAAAKGPRFADPLELWGEALLIQGDAKGAAAKFAEAAKLAPRWGRLHLKWGEALAKLGRADEARAKWRAATTMDLSAADRAALKAHGV